MTDLQQTSLRYEGIFNGPHTVIYTAYIYGEMDGTPTRRTINGANLISLKRTVSLYDGKPTVGNCVSERLELTFRNTLSPELEKSYMPRMAKIALMTAVQNETMTSEWIPAGVFFIDQRKHETVAGADIMTITAYDCVMKLEQNYYAAAASGWPKTMKNCAEDIAQLIGTEIDYRTNLSQTFTVQLDTTLTMREYMGYIAAAHAGTWVSTPDGALRLVSLFQVRHTSTGNTGDWINVGNKASMLETGTPEDPYSGVIVRRKVDGEDADEYTAGSFDTETVLETELPWATQAIADAIWDTISGYVYTPFTAKDVKLNPAAEIGDGIQIGTIYSIIASRTSEASAIEADEIGAGSENEVDHEFKYESPIERSIRNIRSATAQLRVEAGQIEARVEDAEGDISSLELDVGGILAQVTDAQGNYTVLTMNASGIIVKGNSGEIEIDGGQLKAGTVIADRIVAESVIQSPIIRSGGGEYEITASRTDGLSVVWVDARTAGRVQTLSAYYDGLGRSYFETIDEGLMAFESLGNNSKVELLPPIVSIKHRLVLDEAYGTSAPTGTGTSGQLYFQIVS